MNLSPIRASRPVARPAPTEASAALQDRASEASAFLKALSHEGRLLILCHLGEGERSVTELERLLGARQSAVSQQLARLRLEGLVDNRRDGKTIYYRIADPKARALIASLHDLFCAED
ncbi:MAG: metalloregulator ArsR/SmtB family transcription factor [Pseudomonadota bacterium]